MSGSRFDIAYTWLRTEGSGLILSADARLELRIDLAAPRGAIEKPARHQQRRGVDELPPRNEVRLLSVVTVTVGIGHWFPRGRTGKSYRRSSGARNRADIRVGARRSG